MTREALWQELSAQGLVNGEIPAAAASVQPTPWPVRVMLGAAGWLGALFLFAFAGMVLKDLLDQAVTGLTVGAFCLLGAYGIFVSAKNSDIASQFAFALSLAGQALLLYGIYNLGHKHDSAGSFLLMALAELAVALVIPNYIHRVFTTILANFWLLLAFDVLHVPALPVALCALACVVIWLRAPLIAKWPSLCEPLGYGFAIALLTAEASLLDGGLFGRDSSYMASRLIPWIAPAVTGLLVLVTVWDLLRQRYGGKVSGSASLCALSGAFIVAAFGFAAPGLSASILVIVLGFANGKKVLTGVGLVAFAGYLSHFYYSWNLTLLVKSEVLAATGTALLALRWFLLRALPPSEEQL